MPHDMTESDATFPEPISVPDEGELATATALDAILQKLADRSQWLRTLLESLGVRFFRRVASTAELTAINVATLTDGEMRLVAGTEYTGLYRYVAASVATTRAIWILPPDSGGGRWINILADIAGVAGFSHALATLDADMRLEQLPLNALVALSVLSGVKTLDTSAAYPTDVSAATVSLVDAAVGDRVKITARVGVVSGDVHPTTIGVRVSENGGAYSLATAVSADAALVKLGGSASDVQTLTFVHEVGVDGTVAIKVAAGRSGTTGGTNDHYDVYSLVAELVRP